MKTFLEYLIESSGKNVHLEHLEDSVFNAGVAGTRQAINFLRSIRNMLSGHASSGVNVTVKWDGAPAIICGTNPENGKFFVATKSAFNKNPKLNYTHGDIEKNHGEVPNLVETLKVALDNLKPLKIKGILQGDFLFLPRDIKKTKFEGESLITFRRNTITYAIPEDSELAKTILAANMGVVFHTTYTGSTIQDLKASFGANVDSLKNSSKVWVTDASFKDTSGAASLTQSENEHVTSLLSELGKTFHKMNSTVVAEIVADEELILHIKTYVNSKIKTGENIQGTKKYAKGLVEFITNKYSQEIDKLKQEKSKQAKLAKLKNVLSFVNANKDQLIVMFLIAAMIADVKTVLLKKLKKVSSIGTFLETPDGFKVTTPEGFVAIDHIGNAVKLVDRLEFSKANFTLDKGW